MTMISAFRDGESMCFKVLRDESSVEKIKY